MNYENSSYSLFSLISIPGQYFVVFTHLGLSIGPGLIPLDHDLCLPLRLLKRTCFVQNPLSQYNTIGNQSIEFQVNHFSLQVFVTLSSPRDFHVQGRPICIPMPPWVNYVRLLSAGI